MLIDKIVCVGKNYLDHAMELGDAVPEKPVLFLKPSSVLKQASHWEEQLHLYYPNEDTMVQPECEIVLRLGKDGFKLTKEEARNIVSDVTLGLDMTLRSRQTQLKKQGHPWTTAKVFKDAAVLGPWIPLDTFENYLETDFEFSVDGKVRQSAKGLDMMMQPEDLLIYISHFFPLKAGDIIYTGTPAGVSSVNSGSKAMLCWNNYYFGITWE